MYGCTGNAPTFGVIERPPLFLACFQVCCYGQEIRVKRSREEEEGNNEGWKCLHSSDMYFTDIFFLFSLDVLPAKDPEALHAL